MVEVHGDAEEVDEAEVEVEGEVEGEMGKGRKQQ